MASTQTIEPPQKLKPSYSPKPKRSRLVMQGEEEDLPTPEPITNNPSQGRVGNGTKS